MRKSHPFNKNEIIFLSISMVAFTSICFSVALWKYNTLRSNWPFDLAFFNHWFWNLTHGYKFVTLTPGGGVNGLDIFKVDHFSVIRFLLAPFYSLSPGTQTLFFLQITIFSSGIIGAYLIGRFYGKNNLTGVVLAVFYMFFPPIFNLAIYDFNPLCLALPFLIFSFYFYSKKNLRWFIVFALLALSAREQVIVSIILLGMLSFLTKERFSDKIKWFLWPVSLCIFYAILFIFYMHAYHHQILWIGFTKNLTLGYLSDSNFLDSIKNTGLFLFKNYSWWLFLAGLSPLFLLIALPNFLYLFLLYDELTIGPYYPDLKYITIPTVAIFICCGLSLCKVYSILRYKKKVLYLVISLLFLFLIGGWLQNLNSVFNFPRRFTLSEIKELHSLSKQIRISDTVLTSYLLSPLFSSRKEIYCYEELGPYFDWSYVLKRADYIIIQKIHSDTCNRLIGVDIFKKTQETENLIFYKRTRNS